MTERPGDDEQEPPGGHAAERLREFEAARKAPESDREDDDTDDQKPGDAKRRGSEDTEER